MAHRDGAGRRAGRRLPARLLTAVAVSLLVAGCGTRLEDARIKAAAGVGPAKSGDELAGAGLDATGALPAAGPDANATAAAAEAVTASAGSALSPSPAAGSAASSVGSSTKVTGTGARAPAAASSASPAGASSNAPVAGGGAEPGPAPDGGAPVPGAPAPGAAKPPIVLGHIGDYSGLIGTLMKGGNVMAAVIARTINDHGGLDGHPVQVISGDAGGDPARALALARDMVENEGAVAFFGTLMVFSGNGPRDYLEQRKIPIIGGDGTTNVWLQSPMYFTSSANFPGISLGAMKGLVDLGKKKLAILYCVEAEQCKTWHDTAVDKAPSVGAEIVYEAQVSLAQPDFTAECIQAQRNGADGVMTGVDGPSVARIARACAQQGYKPQFMTASLAVIESIAKDPNLDGLMAPQGAFPHMADDLSGERDYHAAIQQYAPSLEKSPAVATVWVAGALLREVAKTLPPGQVTSADFFPGLYAVKNNTLGGLVGPLTFNEGKTASEVRCVFFIRVAGGKWTAPDGSKQNCF